MPRQDKTWGYKTIIGHQIWELEKISRGLRDNSKHRYIDRRIRKCPHPVEEEFSDLWFFY